MYYNSYTPQVLRHWEGELWDKWNLKMRDSLIPRQAKASYEEGSWFFNGDSGSEPGGRLYSTAMSTMILEVYYRHMPIYRSQAVASEFPPPTDIPLPSIFGHVKLAGRVLETPMLYLLLFLFEKQTGAAIKVPWEKHPKNFDKKSRCEMGNVSIHTGFGGRFLLNPRREVAGLWVVRNFLKSGLRSLSMLEFRDLSQNFFSQKLRPSLAKGRVEDGLRFTGPRPIRAEEKGSGKAPFG